MKDIAEEIKEKIIIRHATLCDIERVQAFLKDYWDDPNHIFITNTEYLRYYHVVDGSFNFYLGEGTESKKIYGICGYILANRQIKADVQINLLLVIKNKNSFSSIELLDYMKKDLSPHTFCACGVRPKVKVIYEFLGYHTGMLGHYYRLSDRDSYSVAVVSDKVIPSIRGGKYKLYQIPNFEEFKRRFDTKRYINANPYKDDWCINHRYFDSMGHKYKVYGIDKGENIFDSVIVMRELNVNGAKICKVIDFIGIDSDIAQLSYEFQRLIDERDYEYLDFYCAGIKHETLIKAGFILRTAEDKNIIPQLFEPFVQSNKDIYYFTDNPKNFHLYLGDSDQDRANIIGYTD